MLTRPTELKLAHSTGTIPNCEYLAGYLCRGRYDGYTEENGCNMDFSKITEFNIILEVSL